MTFSIESEGRCLNVVANFTDKEITIESDSAGKVSRSTLSVPAHAIVFDNATTIAPSLSNDRLGRRKDIYFLDPNTITLVKAQIVNQDSEQIVVNGKTQSAQVMALNDPRQSLTFFSDQKGDLLKVQSRLGLLIVPEPKEVAMKLSTPSAFEPKLPDIASTFAIKPDQLIERPGETTSLKLSVYGGNMQKVPSDASQDIWAQKDFYSVTLKPIRGDSRKASKISKVAPEMYRWTVDDTYIPASSKEMKSLASKILGPETNLVLASLKIKNYVFNNMKSNGGIAIFRDAREILQTKEGVCRDYAILTATLMRSAGIPTRLVSGMTYQNDSFYYHAWVEGWDGKRWIGYDATQEEPFIDATHLKLAQGTFADAFTASKLYGAKLTIEEVRYK